MNLIMIGDDLSYAQRVKAVFGGDLLGLWELQRDAKDRSGRGFDGTPVNVSFADGWAVFDGSTSYVNIHSAALAALFSGAAGTVYLEFHSDAATWLDTATRLMARIQVDTSNRVYLDKSSSNDQMDFFYTAGGVTKSYTLDKVADGRAGDMSLAITWDKAADAAKCYVNGAQVGSTLSGLGTWVGTPGVMTIGSGSTAPAQVTSGRIRRVVLAKRAATAAELLRLDLLRRSLVVLEGDSRTSGTGAATYNTYPDVCVRQLNGGWIVANVGESGQTVATMITQIAAQVAALMGNYGKHIAVLWGGVNDNTDAATMHGRIQTWCETVRALGYRVVVCTEIDAQDAAHTDWHATNYQALNALIAANWTTYADALADLGGAVELQDATNTTYYNADKLHLTPAGYAVVAGLVAAAVNGL